MHIRLLANAMIGIVQGMPEELEVAFVPRLRLELAAAAGTVLSAWVLETVAAAVGFGLRFL